MSTVGACSVAISGVAALCFWVAAKGHLPVAQYRGTEAAINFCENWAELAGILLFAFQCENYPIFQHGAKEHDFDMFWFVVLAFGTVAALNIRPTKDQSVLGREQSEEWKGWMQFMFLLYHYYEVGEVYNAIRIMITAYVWMTGFGNGVFFSLKQDFGWVRLLQMLWRLNFFVLMLMLVNNTSYILYYICPLHTFWFLMCYAAMFVGCKIGGKTPTGMRLTLLAFAVGIFLLWDTSGTVFDVAFGYILGNKPQLGAKNGLAWEWYFRTTLDHWSALFGMAFALNYARCAAWLQAAADLPPRRMTLTLGVATVVLLGGFTWWCRSVFVLNKMAYNNYNAYTGLIPVLGYIFIRNCHPFLRRWYVYPLYEFGKTTLETYLLQHHIWLTSNAKTVLTIVPGMPKSNFLVCTVLFVCLSRQTFRVCMAIRGHVLPDKDVTACFKNLGVLASTVCGVYVVASIYTTLFPLPIRLLFVGVTGVAIAMSAFMCLQPALRHENSDAESGKEAELEPLAADSAGDGEAHNLTPADRDRSSYGFPILILVLSFLAGFTLLADRRQALPALPYRCTQALRTSPGHWISMHKIPGTKGGAGVVSAPRHGPRPEPTCIGPGQARSSGQLGACSVKSFRFDDSRDTAMGFGCDFHAYAGKTAQALLGERRRVAVIGDSQARYLFRSMCDALGVQIPEGGAKHADITPTTLAGSDDVDVRFFWAPTAKEVQERLPTILRWNQTEAHNPKGEEFPGFMVFSVGLWDTLHKKDIATFFAEMKAVGKTVRSFRPPGAPDLGAVSGQDGAPQPVRGGPVTVLVTPPTIRNSKLNTPEKRAHMTEAHVSVFRDGMLAGAAEWGLGDILLDFGYLTRDPESDWDTTDGIHYPTVYYEAATQILFNSVKYLRRLPDSETPPPPPLTSKPPGGMGNPGLGLVMIAVLAVTLITGDSYVGVFHLSSYLFSGSKDKAFGQPVSPRQSKEPKAHVKSDDAKSPGVSA
mmetsp:Transcript_43559/g.103536  ORF Transcript_43559/g.103536 Transcript_43559/m.103536 type:complete len:981 (-) Transcript_43559:64-3006(-)